MILGDSMKESGQIRPPGLVKPHRSAWWHFRGEVHTHTHTYFKYARTLTWLFILCLSTSLSFTVLTCQQQVHQPCTHKRTHAVGKCMLAHTHSVKCHGLLFFLFFFLYWSTNGSVILTTRMPVDCVKTEFTLLLSLLSLYTNFFGLGLNQHKKYDTCKKYNWTTAAEV